MKMSSFLVYLPSSIFLMALLLNPVKSSRGDKCGPFVVCMRECSKGCSLNEYPGKLPIYLTMFWWDCSDECKYQCMHNVTASDVRRNKRIKQFYGKWPFIRLLGIQEPASVLFSIFNGVGHILGWRMLTSTVPNTDYNMYSVWKANLLVCVNGWFWSTVFHTRDLNWTEKMDYFCATSMVMYSFFACLMRFIGLENKCSCVFIGLSLCCIFCCHIFYLAFVHFDYGYNMKFNVTIGIINLCSWVSWCLTNYQQQPYVWKCAVVTVGVFLLLGLEFSGCFFGLLCIACVVPVRQCIVLFTCCTHQAKRKPLNLYYLLGDFPPILWTFDAHSLWHLGTAPLCYFWYSFLVDDAKYQLSLKTKTKKSP